MLERGSFELGCWCFGCERAVFGYVVMDVGVNLRNIEDSRPQKKECF